MFTLAFTKSSSKKYPEALRLAMSLGASVEGKEVKLSIAGSELLFAYRKLFPLIEIISKWKGTSATYRSVSVYPYRFIFELWNTVAGCSAQMNKSGNPVHCQKSPSEKGWGCKYISSIKRHLSGTGDYEKGHHYWYNYGWFESNGDWTIDKITVYEKLKSEITRRGLDACPFFDITKINQEVIDELPDKIIIDHVTFRPHFEIRYIKGERKVEPVNIRHINDPAASFANREKKLVHGLGESMFYAVNELEIPKAVLQRNKKLSDKLEVLRSTEFIGNVFEKGICKN